MSGAVAKLKGRIAPGPDGLMAEHLKGGGEAVPGHQDQMGGGEAVVTRTRWVVGKLWSFG